MSGPGSILLFCSGWRNLELVGSDYETGLFHSYELNFLWLLGRGR